MGWSAVRNRLLSEVGNSWLGIGSLGWETTVKDYGVTVVRRGGRAGCLTRQPNRSERGNRLGPFRTPVRPGRDERIGRRLPKGTSGAEPP